VQHLHLKLFGAMVWKLLTIEPFFNENQIKSKFKTVLGVFLVLLKSPWQVRFNKFYFIFFKTKVWNILIFEWISFLEIQKNCKI